MTASMRDDDAMAAIEDDADAGIVLSQDAPTVTPGEAADVLRSLYGLEGELKALPSERDHNFHVRGSDGRQYVLKFTHPGEPRSVTNFQTEALRHIAAADPTLPVPVVFPTGDGDLEPEYHVAGAAPRTVRLLSYLRGRILEQAPPSPAQDYALGAFLARLGKALRGFSHDAAGSIHLLWDLREIARVRPMLSEIGDAARRAMVAGALDIARDEVLPLLPALRAQVTHNDLNPSNVVVAESDSAEVAGVLDFGDMIHGPLICDVAVGAAYRLSPDEHPLAAAGRFIAGYHRVTPLEEPELGVLFDLIRARVAASQAIVSWQARRFPEKRDYVLRLGEELWIFLEDMDALSRADALAYLRSAIEES